MPFRIRSAADDKRLGATIAFFDQLRLCATQTPRRRLRDAVASWTTNSSNSANRPSSSSSWTITLVKYSSHLLGRIANIQVAGRGLLQQFQLRGELGFSFDADQFADARLQRTADTIQRSKDVTDRIDDLGSLGGVVDPQVADRFGQQLQLRSCWRRFLRPAFWLRQRWRPQQLARPLCSTRMT